MASDVAVKSFTRSRSGRALGLFLCFAFVVAIAFGWGFYRASLNWLVEHKDDEKTIAFGLAGAFMQSSAELRDKLGKDAPVNEMVRAHANTLFPNAPGNGTFALRLLRTDDAASTTGDVDPSLRAALRSFAHTHDPQPITEMLAIGGKLTARAIYPAFAREQDCVDCHNRLEPGRHLQLGDFVGALAIDVPVEKVVESSAKQAAILVAALFAVLAAAGFVVALLQYRQTRARERIEDSLRESEERFRDFAASASDWFWELDANLRFTVLSRGAPHAGVQHFGKTRRELIQALGLHVSEEQLRAHEELLEQRQPFHNLRIEETTPSGEVRHISVSGRPVFGGSGRFAGYRGTGRDVTDEVAVELELARRVEKRTDELRAAQNELVRKEKLSILGQLTGTVSHELRNPLSAIRNTVFALRQSTASSGSDLDRPLARIERNIKRCDHIIGELLDFTRMPALNRAPIVADQWLEELVHEQPLPDGVRVAFDLGACGQRLECDAERMRCVVVNLIENAAQATAAKGGTVTVRSRAAGGIYVLAITDEGAGIKPDILPKVFEPLFSTKSFGTGLGLAIVKQIVEQHGGSVEIASQEDKGTEVVVRLPGLAAELAA